MDNGIFTGYQQAAGWVLIIVSHDSLFQNTNPQLQSLSSTLINLSPIRDPRVSVSPFILDNNLNYDPNQQIGKIDISNKLKDLQIQNAAFPI
jgi:hypothetical protein